MALDIFRFIPFSIPFRFPFRVLVTPDKETLLCSIFSRGKQHVRLTGSMYVYSPNEMNVPCAQVME